MAKAGRPTKLTEDLIEQIAKLVREGNYIETACAFCGINKDTYYRWAKDGARAKSGIKKRFSDAIKKAVAESEMNDLETIRLDPSWQSKAWRLERRFPDKWGNRQKVELSGNVNIGKVKKLAEEVLSEDPATGNNK